MICIPITEIRARDFLAAIHEAAEVADAIELRLDYLNATDLASVLTAIPVVSQPLIFTFRPREQGGQRDLTLIDRQQFWRNLEPELIGYADMELDLVESLLDRPPPIPWDKVICSYHDFQSTPDNLTGVLERLMRTPARVVKIATLARSVTDCVPVFEVIDRAGARPVIALAMGLAGVATRVLAPSRGALLTFGALRQGAESACGQPTVGELRDLYRVESLTRASEIYGVIGYPIGHSLSPAIHNSALAAEGRDAVYLPFEVENLDAFMRDMAHPRTRRIDWRLRGLSVTIPHKLDVIAYLDEVEPLARRIGAVNTVAIEGERLLGYNTDVMGAMSPLDDVFDVRGARVAVLGAGGAARAVLYGLAERSAEVTVYARDLKKAGVLAEEFEARSSALESFAGDTDVVINCTPIGMKGHREGQSPVRREALNGVKLVYDLVYNPEETELLKEAREMGCLTLGGMAMLTAQADAQRRIWQENQKAKR